MPHDPRKPFDLIDDLRYVSCCKTLRFTAKWNIELSAFIEPDQTSETSSVEKQKVEWIANIVETLSNNVIVIFSFTCQKASFLFKKKTSNPARYSARLDGPVQSNQVRIQVRQEGGRWVYILWDNG